MRPARQRINVPTMGNLSGGPGVTGAMATQLTADTVLPADGTLLGSGRPEQRQILAEAFEQAGR